MSNAITRDNIDDFVGSEVVVINPGQCYSTHTNAAACLDAGPKWVIGYGPPRGATGIIKGHIIMHTTLIILVENAEHAFLIGPHGIRLANEVVIKSIW